MTYTIEQLDAILEEDRYNSTLEYHAVTQLRDALATIERIEAWFWEHDGKMMDIDYDMFWPQTKQALNK